MQLLMRVRAFELLCSSVEVMDFTQDLPLELLCQKSFLELNSIFRMMRAPNEFS